MRRLSFVRDRSESVFSTATALGGGVGDKVSSILSALEESNVRRKSSLRAKIFSALSGRTIDELSTRRIELPTVAEEYTDQSVITKREKIQCGFDESPYYILKLAAHGNLDAMVRLVNEDTSRLTVSDFRWQNIFHYAASASQIAILDYAYNFVDIINVDLNAQDKLGNTPLHCAIEKSSMISFDWLLLHGANLQIKNVNNQAPIHLCVERNEQEMVEKLLDEDAEIVHIPGDLGYTPLMYACKYDRPEIAKLLLNRGADLMQNCSVGYCAIHAATRAGCARVVDVLIEFAEKKGISGRSLIHTFDKEHNLPLHAAVNSGDLTAVVVCLKAGAEINAQHLQDKQTAVHYAAAKGALDIIRVMFRFQPEQVELCIHSRDIMEQTPLHKAAGFNHVEVVQFLLDQGSFINAQDKEQRTPLVLAASKNAYRVVNFLLKRRPNTSLRDKDNRNFLHMAIITGMRLRDLEIDSLRNLGQLLNERDDFGCTPVHYASRAGQLASLKNLLILGAQVTLKDNEKQNPLHCAARYGRLYACKNLLASEDGPIMINEVDGDGHSALHVAAIYGHGKIIAYLISKGALLTRDFQLNTALHLAGEYGSYEVIVLLMGLAPHLLNSKNKFGNTAIHLAAMNGHALVVDYLMTADCSFEQNIEGASFLDLAILKSQIDVVAAVIRHSRCEEVMQIEGVFGLPILGLIQHMPKICVLFLDKCLTYSDDSRKSPNFFIEHNFSYLITPETLTQDSYEKSGKVMPLWPLNMMVRHNRLECLSHPLCANFLNQKWNSYGSPIYNARMALHLLVLIIVTYVGNNVDLAFTNSMNANSTQAQKYISPCNSDFCLTSMNEFTVRILILMIIILLFSYVNLGLHFFNMSQQRLSYFLDGTHYIDLTYYVSIIVMAQPSVLGLPSFRAQYVASALCLFTGWVTLLLYMQRFAAFFGLLVVSFVAIFKSLIKAMIVFSFVIIAFTLTFVLIFRRKNGRTLTDNDPAVAIAPTLAMMLGNILYDENIVPNYHGDPDHRVLIPPLTYVLFVVFIMVMSILLKNLLIGLAVGNIESVQKNARLQRLAMRVEYFTSLDHRLPRAFVKKREQLNYKLYPNRRVNKMLQAMKSFFGKSSVGRDDSAVGFTREIEDANAEASYILQELSLQSRRLATLSARYEMHYDMVKMILQKLDCNVIGNVQNTEREYETGDDEDDVPDRRKAHRFNHSTSFHSANSSAQWHAVDKRLAGRFKKSRARNIWRSTTDDVSEVDEQNRRTSNIELLSLSDRLSSTSTTTETAKEDDAKQDDIEDDDEIRELNPRLVQMRRNRRSMSVATLPMYTQPSNNNHRISFKRLL